MSKIDVPIYIVQYLFKLTCKLYLSFYVFKIAFFKNSFFLPCTKFSSFRYKYRTLHDTCVNDETAVVIMTSFSRSS